MKLERRRCRQARRALLAGGAPISGPSGRTRPGTTAGTEGVWIRAIRDPICRCCAIRSRLRGERPLYHSRRPTSCEEASKPDRGCRYHEAMRCWWEERPHLRPAREVAHRGNFGSPRKSTSQVRAVAKTPARRRRGVWLSLTRDRHVSTPAGSRGRGTVRRQCAGPPDHERRRDVRLQSMLRVPGFKADRANLRPRCLKLSSHGWFGGSTCVPGTRSASPPLHFKRS